MSGLGIAIEETKEIKERQILSFLKHICKICDGTYGYRARSSRAIDETGLGPVVRIIKCANYIFRSRKNIARSPHAIMLLPDASFLHFEGAVCCCAEAEEDARCRQYMDQHLRRHYQAVVQELQGSNSRKRITLAKRERLTSRLMIAPYAQ